jgi:hypothetical protein
VRRLLEVLRAAGQPHVVGAEGVAKVKALKRAEAEAESERRGLPD